MRYEFDWPWLFALPREPALSQGNVCARARTPQVAPVALR
jgi:hypothetical protein